MTMPSEPFRGTWLENGNFYEDDRGYWYITEDESLNGPLRTLEEARDAQGAYVHYLETGESLTPEEWVALKEGK